MNLFPKMVMDPILESANVYGELSSEIFATENLQKSKFLVFPFKMCVHLVDFQDGKISKLTGTASITAVGKYLIRLSSTNCLYLYTGDLLMAQINAPQLISVRVEN